MDIRTGRWGGTDPRTPDRQVRPVVWVIDENTVFTKAVNRYGKGKTSAEELVRLLQLGRAARSAPRAYRPQEMRRRGGQS